MREITSPFDGFGSPFWQRRAGGGGGTDWPTNGIYNYSENLAADPPTFSFTSMRPGTWTWDFHSSATPPTLGGGDIATGSAAIVLGANTGLEIDLSAYPGETGYIHHRVTDGAAEVSNTLTSGQITTAATAITRVGGGAAGAATIGPITGQLAGDLIVITSWRANNTLPTTGTGFTSIFTRAGASGGQSARVQTRIATADAESFSGFTNATVLLCEVFRGASAIGGFASALSDIHEVPTIPALTPTGGATSWAGAAILARTTSAYDPGACGPFTKNNNSVSRWSLTHGPTSTFSAQAATNATGGASAGNITMHYEVLP